MASPSIEIFHDPTSSGPDEVTFFARIPATDGPLHLADIEFGVSDPGKPIRTIIAFGQQRFFVGMMEPHFQWKAASGKTCVASTQFDAGHRVNTEHDLRINALQGKEVSLVGQFPMPWDGNWAAEVRAVNTTGMWHVGTQVFRAVANTPNAGKQRTTLADASDTESFFNAILSHPSNLIARLNLFSHGNPGLCAFSGHLRHDLNDPEPYQIRFDRTDPKDRWKEITVEVNGTTTKIDAPLAGPLDNGTMNWLISNPLGMQYRSSLRDVLTPDADILLFLCCSGVGTGASLAQDIADFFNRRVLTFNDFIGYYVFPPDKSYFTAFPQISDPTAQQSAHDNGTMARGYPCAVPLPPGVPDGQHIVDLNRVPPVPRSYTPNPSSVFGR